MKETIKRQSVMERKIGEIFEYNGEWYQYVKDDMYDYCKDCAFFINLSCRALYGNSDCWLKATCKKLEKWGEPYPNDDKLYQLYRLPMNIEKLPPHTEGINLVRFDIVEIEIKQNKEDEDMEEKKLNLKPFDIQKAREGKPVCTRDGRRVRIICFDAKRRDEKSIIALVPNKDRPGFEDLIAYPNNGNYYGGHENDGDLMMLPEKRVGWININKDASLFKSREEAERNCTKDYVPVSVEFEI